MASAAEQLAAKVAKLRNGGYAIAHERDRDRLLEFVESAEAFELRAGSINEYLGKLIALAEEGPVPLADTLESWDAAKRYKKMIKANPEWSPRTGENYLTAMRSFGKYLNGRETPESLAKLPTDLTEEATTGPPESGLVDWFDDILPMVDAAGVTGNPNRNAAMPAVALEVGASESEFREIRLEHITVDDDGPTNRPSYRVHIPGGTRGHKERDVPVIASAPLLAAWLRAHPAWPNGDPSTPLWCKPDGREMTRDGIAKAIERLADAAGVTKKVHLRNIRFSSVRWRTMMRQNARLIEQIQGRSPGSDLVRRYATKFGPENIQAQTESLLGFESDAPEPEDFRPRRCDACGAWNIAGVATCRCGADLRPDDALEDGPGGARSDLDAVLDRVHAHLSGEDVELGGTEEKLLGLLARGGVDPDADLPAARVVVDPDAEPGETVTVKGPPSG